MSTSFNDASTGPLPSGTVAFVFTDIEGSTQRWERSRAAMEEAVRRHDGLMRAAFAAHHGHIFKTIGDAFCAAFARPEDAVAAIYDAQRALGAEDFSAVDGLRVRAAIHTGTADERDGDYFGLAVNRVARLLGIGHGGQVLVSGVTSDLVQGALPPRASLRDLGEHRLKDLARPEYVYQLLAPDLQADFPPLRSLDTLQNNLPRTLTSFVGRETEIAEITALIERHQLVTLVGSGGIGKTRTSLQVAANLLDGSRDGVWFVELAPLSSGDYIPTTIAQAIGLTLASDGDPLQHLVNALKAKRALLIVDNCEHLVQPAARAISAILRGCPQVKVISSSRQGLGIAGEETYRMPSLGVPSPDTVALLRAIDAAASPAIALFVERARSADKRFEFTDENAPIVADICRRLDGIALAIELAASRVKILSPKQLRDRLDERFRVLTGGSRDVLPRQQTLRALIDWSHDLLDERERTLFRRLGIFVNGFTLGAAAAVASDETFDEFEIFDVFASLVEKSLVIAEPSGDSLRYRLLESTRAYAGEKLAEAGERERLASRHLQYFLGSFRKLRASVNRSLRTQEFNAAFEAELEDLRVALDGALARSDVDTGAELLAEIGATWLFFGTSAEGCSRLDAFLASADRSNAILVARLYTALANLHNHNFRRPPERESALEAVSYARLSGDDETLGFAIVAYARFCAASKHFDDTEAALAEAEVISNPSKLLNRFLIQLRGTLSFEKADFDAAQRAHELIIKESRAAGNVREVHTYLVDITEIEHARGDTLRAIALLREMLPELRQSPDRVELTRALANLTGYLVAIDDLAAAVEAAREAIDVLAAREPEHVHVASAIEHLSLAYALRGDFARATMLEGYVDACLRRVEMEREPTEQGTNDRLRPLLSAHFSADDLARLTAEGAALAPEAAIALALQESAS